MNAERTPTRALVISSLGNLDVAAITLMGLSTKRGDTEKIGMFGTGLKYSIAKLLRDRIPFRVWNGTEELSIATRAGDFRGTAYEQVLVNGEATSITTDMGPLWEDWWIVRELLSNARDEPAHEFYVRPWNEVEFPEGWTVFALDYDVFEQVWLAREKYFVTDRLPKWEGEKLRLYSRWNKAGTRIYKNGILIHEDESEDAFDYDVLDAPLNEMREPRHSGHFSNDITEKLLEFLDDEKLIRDWLNRVNTHLRALKPTFTGSLWSFNAMGVKLSETWRTVVDNSEERFHGWEGLLDSSTDGILVPKDVYKVIQTHVEKDKPLELADPTPAQDAALKNALGKLFEAGVEIRYPIKVAELGTQTIAQAINGTIVLTTRSFETENRLVECLLEEALHIATGLSDGTRGFQTAIFEWWTNTILKNTTR